MKFKNRKSESANRVVWVDSSKRVFFGLFRVKQVIILAILIVVIAVAYVVTRQLIKNNTPTSQSPKSEMLTQLENVPIEGAEPLLASRHLLSLGNEYKRAGLNDKAEKTYKQSLKLVNGKDKIDPLNALYSLYIANKQMSSAIEVANPLVELLIEQNNIYKYPLIVELENLLGNTENANKYKKMHEDEIKKHPISAEQDGSY